MRLQIQKESDQLRKSSTNPKILFVHNGNESFVQIDLKILSEKWQVIDRYETSPVKLNPFAVYRDVQKSDLIFCWFASWHAVLPIIFAKALHKPSFVIIGGYDTANVPKANYGSQRGGLRKIISRFVIQNASHLITNSYSAYHEAINNAQAKPEKITVIHHGITPYQLSSEKNRLLVINVGGVRHQNLLRKGLLPFVQTAKLLPEFQFVVAGKWFDSSIETLKKEAGTNVKFTGYISDEDLTRLYQQASVYVQASLHEGFGMSVAEAMTAGCIPVLTRAGSLPEVAGDAGIYAQSNAPEHLAEAIQKALQCDESMREKARQRIVENFPMSKRTTALYKLIEDTTQN